jgi:hypothetical protein
MPIDPKEYSPQAVGIALFEVVHRIFDRLVKHQIMTDDEVTALFAKAGEEHSLSDRPANIEAGELLAWVAKERARKFR